MENRKDKQRKFPWDVLGYVFFSVLIMFVGLSVGTIIFGFGISAVFMLVRNAIPSFTPEIIDTYILLAPFLMIWIILFVYARKGQKSSITQLWFGGEKKKGKSLVIGILIAGIVCSLSVGVAALFGGLRFSYFTFEPITLVLVALFGLIQSGAEELLFRGFMLQGLMKKHSAALAVILNSVVFAMMHINNPGITIGAIINITMLGIAFSLVVVKWNRLSVAVGMHFMWNFTEEIIFGTPNSGTVFARPILVAGEANTSWFYHQQFGIEASVQTFILWTLVALFIFMKIKKKPAEAVKEG